MIKPAFQLTGKVEHVLVASQSDSLLSTPVKKIRLIQGRGIRGDVHAGTRLIDSREKALLSFGLLKGMEIANHREFSAISLEELNEIAQSMNLPRSIPFGSLGENLVISGVPKFTELPVGTTFFFRKDETQIRTAVLVVWAENTPCEGPGRVIQGCFPEIPNLAALFPKCAMRKRGIVGSIDVSGEVHAGDTVIVNIPRQQMYEP